LEGQLKPARGECVPFSALASRLLEKITGETAASTVGFMPDNNVTTPVGEKFRSVRERHKTPIPLGKLGG